MDIDWQQKYEALAAAFAAYKETHPTTVRWIPGTVIEAPYRNAAACVTVLHTTDELVFFDASMSGKAIERVTPTRPPEEA